MSVRPRPPARDGAVPAWVLASSALAPVAMIGGWTLAAAVQPDGFDPVRETISALATRSVASPAIMTAGLAVTGICHVVTAAGLRAAAPAGRALLALGGVGTAVVAALPVDVQSRGHGIAAGVAFVALAVWPAVSPRSGRPGGVATDACSGMPGAVAADLLAPRPARAASAGLLALLVWFVLELQGLLPGDGALTGLSERALAGAQSLWPLAVVLSVRPRRAGRRARGYPRRVTEELALTTDPVELPGVEPADPPTELIPGGLWQGGVPVDFDWVRRTGITALIDFADPDTYPPAGATDGIVYMKAPLVDGEDVPDPTLTLPLASLVAGLIADGYRVLVHCTFGRNRSGLMASLIVRKALGLSGEDAMRYVQERRRGTVNNETFAAWLRTLPAED